jgi:hypothetical protein
VFIALIAVGKFRVLNLGVHPNIGVEVNLSQPVFVVS